MDVWMDYQMNEWQLKTVLKKDHSNNIRPFLVTRKQNELLRDVKQMHLCVG